jgi:hypothetical protein
MKIGGESSANWTVCVVFLTRPFPETAQTGQFALLFLRSIPMASFKLTKDTSTFELDTNGKVKKDGANFGTWKTNKSNQIVVSGGGGPVIFGDIVWKFVDGANQLTIRTAGDKEIFNFHKAGGLRPFYEISPKAVLRVFPDENEGFSFELRGEWGLDANHDLTIKIGEETSVIDGFVDDPKSRFTYFFLDKDKNDFNLVFIGRWLEPTVDETGVKFAFEYETEGKKRSGGTATAQFRLPKSATIDRGINQFVYDYDKNLKSRRIKFAGLLNVTKDFQIVYSIDSQKFDDASGVAVKSTEFRLGAVLINDKFSGDLEFVLRKSSDGKVSKTVVGIRGHFTADAFGGKIQLGFAFMQIREGAVKTTTVAIEGKLILKNNLTTVQWEFLSKENVKSLTITVTDVVLDDFIINGKVIITAPNGKKKRVAFLLGFQF